MSKPPAGIRLIAAKHGSPARPAEHRRGSKLSNHAAAHHTTKHRHRHIAASVVSRLPTHPDNRLCQAMQLSSAFARPPLAIGRMFLDSMPS